MSAPVVGIVLAAGAGRRFGGAKALVRIDGERLVDRAVRVLRAGGCDDVLVVSGAADVADVDAEVVQNPGWATGMASSLRAGLSAAAGGPWTAAVLLLVDTPWVGVEAVRRVLDARGGAAAVQAEYDGRPGHPVLLERSVWDDVAGQASGDEAARVWLRAHRDRVLAVDCTGTGDPRDVDTREDLTGG